MTRQCTLPQAALLSPADRWTDPDRAAPRRLADGDRAAAGELYDRLGGELYGLALWICRGGGSR